MVDRYGSQFRSSTQHDAQEFLLWLLDKVHEDLNTATKKKYKTIKVCGFFVTLFVVKDWSGQVWLTIINNGIFDTNK